MSDSDDPKPPSPDEISKKLAEFMKTNFGGNVSFAGFPGMDEHDLKSEEVDDTQDEIETRRDNDIFGFDYRPRDIKAHLDRFVIRQDEAKKVLSIAVCDHYNHAKFLRRLEKDDPERAAEVEFAKQNVIVVGPTGVGKTYLIKHIAELIGVPFVKADATKFSETGYVGADVDDLVRELVQEADGDVALAEHGIIYIDEVDKLASKGGAMGRDVSGRGVQTTLLKLMEETHVSVRNPNDMRSQMQAMFDTQRGGGGGAQKDKVSTRHILFIVSGAFSGLEKIIDQRVRKGAIGFGATAAGEISESELFRHAGTQDYIEYGFEAEFIGRLPVRVVCDPLEAADLKEIMLSSEGSLLKQVEREFAAFGIRSKFEESALDIIAERAAEEGTGARGLQTVCERILRDFKFELPGTSVAELVVDEELINDPDAVLARYRELGRAVNVEKVSEEVDCFVRKFGSQHGVDLKFSQEAIAALGEKAAVRHISSLALCESLFKDYQFGLQLIQKNTGRGEFTLEPGAVEDPDGFLSELVVKSYQSESTEEADS
ncbi:MAG: ATP-dependent Clp protease ATP-binding subunit ClpX [Pseudoalteromonas tetraodonis]|jgi:ATP-dependent Clp protease ATP-binding subunit ClpX